MARIGIQPAFGCSAEPANESADREVRVAGRAPRKSWSERRATG